MSYQLSFGYALVFSNKFQSSHKNLVDDITVKSNNAMIPYTCNVLFLRDCNIGAFTVINKSVSIHYRAGTATYVSLLPRAISN